MASNEHRHATGPFGQLREKAKALLTGLPGVDGRLPSDAMEPVDVLKLIDELSIHQTELEIQNDELRRAQGELADLNRRYEELYEFAPCGYVALNRSGFVESVNLAGAALLGIERGAWNCKPFRTYIDPASKGEYSATFRRIKETRKQQSVELKLSAKTGGAVMVLADIAAELDEGGEIRGFRMTLADMTDQKAAEEALREANERYELVLAGTGAGIWDWDVPGRKVLFSPRWKTMRGFAEHDISDSEEEWSKRIHPEDVQRVLAAMREHFEGKTPVFAEEYRVQRKDGSWMWIADRGIARRDATGAVVRMAGSETDITERKRAEEALAAAYKQMQSIIDNASAVVYAFDLEGRFAMANAALAELLDSTPEQMMGKRRHEFMPKEDADWHEANDRQAIEAGKAMEFEEYSRLQGRSITWLTTKFPLRDARGAIYAVAGISAEITERKRMEETLRESRTRLSWVLERTGIGAWLNELPFGELTWDETTKRLFFVSPDAKPTIDLFWSRLHPDDREATEAAVEKAIREGSAYAVDHRAVNPETGEIHWIRSIGQATYGDDGTPARFDGVSLDITERKLTEAALAASEKKYRELVETADSVILRLDSRGVVRFVNDFGLRFFGYSAEELTGRDATVLVPEIEEGSGRHLRSLVKDVLANPSNYGSMTNENVTKDGRSVWVSWSNKAVLDEKGNLLEILSIGNDVTPLKNAEKTLRESERALKEELEAAKLLQRVSTQLIRAEGIQKLYEEILDTAMAAVNADCSSMQILHPERGASGELRLIAHCGFDKKAAEFWEWVTPSSQSTCGIALKTGRRSIITDVENRGAADDSEDMEIYLRTGIRAVQTTPLFSRSGKLLGMLSTHWRKPHEPTSGELRTMDVLARLAADLIDRKQAEEALRRLNETLELKVAERTAEVREAHLKLIESSRDLDAFFRHSLTPMVFLDRNFNFLRVNEAYAKTCRRKAEDFPGLNHFDLYPSDAKAIFEKVVRTKESFQVRARPFLFSDQTERGVTYWNWTLTPLLDEKGDVEALVFALEDVTAEKKAEEGLLRMNKALSEQTAVAETRALQLRRLALELSDAEDRERRRIADILHEDLQQYLAALRFQLQMYIMEKADDQRAGDLIQWVDESIRKCRSLSHELSPPVLHQSGLLAALDWLASDMREKHGLKVRFAGRPEAEPDSPALASMLFRSVRELLFNVVKHSGSDSATVEAHGLEDRIRIGVKDDGRGFDPASAEEKGGKSKGFGLFAIRERVEFAGGRFEIDGAPGKGCRIMLEAPKEVSRKSEPPEATESEAVSKEIEARAPNRVRNIKILVADDHAVLRQGLSRLLATEPDIEVAGQAADGLEAVRLASELAPDVVLMDVTMPVMDGIEATMRIARAHPNIRIIGLSMHDDPGTQEKMTSAGATAYLYKASPVEKLLEAIRGSLS